MRLAKNIGNFVDWCRVIVKGGNGGKGCGKVRWTVNTKYGKPVGGNGGRGGQVFLISTKRVSDLAHVRANYNGGKGRQGEGNYMVGAVGEDKEILVPLGTVVWYEGSMLGELVKEDEKFLIANGGPGGWGNHNFNVLGKDYRSDVGDGEAGAEKKIDLEMKTIANVGLVGFPNAGKSTLLAAISRARPKIASYPFTTLKPFLGSVEYFDEFKVIVADIPGLIKGAHKNKGLGFSFLRHVERCHSLVYILDLDTITQPISPQEQLNILKYELEQYNPALLQKSQIVVANKCDLLTNALESNIMKDINLAISANEMLHIEEFKQILRQLTINLDRSNVFPT